MTEELKTQPEQPKKISKIYTHIGHGLAVLLILFILFCLIKLFMVSVFGGIVVLLLVFNAMRTNVRLDDTIAVGTVRYNILSQAMNMLAEAVQLQSKRITEKSGIPLGVKNPIQTH